MPRLKNSTDFPNHFLRRMLSWCARCAELKPSQVRAANFTTCSAAFRGRAWWSMRILVRIGDAKHFPLKGCQYPGRKRAPVYDLNDRIEALVCVTAHELEHLYDFSQNIRVVKEGYVDSRALRILEAFRENREALLAEWGDAPAAKPVTPKPSKAQARADAASVALYNWEKKLKLAKTKVAKYRAKVRYYERKQAANGGAA